MYGNGAIDIEFSDIGDNPITEEDIDAYDNTVETSISIISSKGDDEEVVIVGDNVTEEGFDASTYVVETNEEVIKKPWLAKLLGL